MSNVSEKKNILLATGIFPPDVGGPATYVASLVRELEALGHDVRVITYADDESRIMNHESRILGINRSQNILFRYAKYFLAVWKQSKKADTIITFDLSSSGIPSALAAKLRRKKILVRLGGDFLWEKAFQKGWTNQPLDKFYEQSFRRPTSARLKLYYKLNRCLLRFFDTVVFTSNWQKDIYLKYYKLKENKVAIIRNSFFQKDRLEKTKARNKKLIFAGRLIKLKNLERVIEAVASFPDMQFDIYGEGPEKENLQLKIKSLSSTLIGDEKLEDRVRVLSKLAHKDFMVKLGESYAAIVPAVSEISPVTMMECIRLGKPVLVTEKCGYYEDFKDDLLFINPMSVDDIKAKLEIVYTKNYYNQYLERIRKLDTSRNYQKVAREWLDLINT